MKSTPSTQKHSSQFIHRDEAFPERGNCGKIRGSQVSSVAPTSGPREAWLGGESSARVPMLPLQMDPQGSATLLPLCVCVCVTALHHVTDAESEDYSVQSASSLVGMGGYGVVPGVTGGGCGGLLQHSAPRSDRQPLRAKLRAHQQAWHRTQHASTSDIRGLPASQSPQLHRLTTAPLFSVLLRGG